MLVSLFLSGVEGFILMRFFDLLDLQQKMEQSKPELAVWIEKNQIEQLKLGKYEANKKWNQGQAVRLLVCYFFFFFSCSSCRR